MTADKQQKNSKKKVPGRPFKKGQSGNPNGRPKKGSAISDILDKLAYEKSRFLPDMTRMEHILLKALEQAEGGDPNARNFVADRLEGKALERVLKQKSNDILEIK